MREEGSNVAGVVPCAGASTRMGTAKALLDAGGRSFMAAVVGALRGGGCDPVVVVTSEDDAAIERKAKEVGALVLPNPDPGEGPITSLRLAIAVLGAHGVAGVAYCPVDHPLVRPETVQQLLATFRTNGAPLVVPVHDGKHGHPAIFGAGLFTELTDPALEGGARTVVHRHLERAALVELDDPGVVADIDTPEAYRTAFTARSRQEAGG